MRQVRALAGRSVRSRTGRFLVEGPQAVREAVRFAPERVVDLYLTDAAAERYPEIVDAARGAGLWLHETADDVLAAMSADAQGVLAVAQTWQSSLDDVLRGAVGQAPHGRAASTPRLVALLSSVRDPGNAGTVIRAADAAGADAVVLTEGSVEPFNPKVVRSTAGSLFHLPVVTGVPVDEAVAALRRAGLTVLAADGGGDHDLDDLADRAVGIGGQLAPADGGTDLRAPTAWLFGTEAQGLSDAELSLADASVRVPIRGHAESLNLATAATVCLYASSRAQR
ncbi:RNA methyltransferase [Luteimicrobium xylanilyticum]|uniref:rRNA methyltransferase 3B, mitochondrial n=1 Tax=Luteimicrobium xylanilyticum TaxID=1133546 RepID=A0A5P9QA86_9MICO|nr:rRNA methyltransferase 3B, mitochondrial [Luteimicrobium xylanilyticum]